MVELGSEPVHVPLRAVELFFEGLHGRHLARNAVLLRQLDGACLYDPLGRPPPHLRSAPAVQPTRRGSSDGRLPARPAVSPPRAAQPHVVKRCGAAARRLFLDSAVLDADALPRHLAEPAPLDRAVRNRICHNFRPSVATGWSAETQIILDYSNCGGGRLDTNAPRLRADRGLLLGDAEPPNANSDKNCVGPVRGLTDTAMHAFREMIEPPARVPAQPLASVTPMLLAGDADPSFTPVVLAATSPSRMTRRSSDADDHHALPQGGADGALKSAV